MTAKQILELQERIKQAKVVSFDVFDTLLFRKVNTPETIFRMVGEKFDFSGFEKYRAEQQNLISQKLYNQYNYPHANMDEIYSYIKETSDIDLDWDSVKEYEIQLEKDALIVNKEMQDIYLYAVSAGKIVVATSDMYLSRKTINEILVANGYNKFNHVFVSSDERKAKFNSEIFSCITKECNVEYQDILHIGDNISADVDIPSKLGINTFLYEKNNKEIDSVECSIMDEALYKILYNDNKSFWYNLGIEVGGPLYLGLFLWLKKHALDGKKIYFLARDGYNLYKICEAMGYNNVQYVLTSRRALILAGITELDDKDIELLPPYTFGQTIQEILDYLGVDINKINNLQECGFSSFDDTLDSAEDIEKFKDIYRNNRRLFLDICRIERENATRYYKSIGVLEDDAIMFDCGWNGSSQFLMSKMLKSMGYEHNLMFYYAGILCSEKSKMQLKGQRYESYLFDHYKNYNLQARLKKAIVLAEMFFSAPHASVHCYGSDGAIYEDDGFDPSKEDILEALIDYIKLGADFAEKYGVQILPDFAMGRLLRLIERPTEDEAENIGNLTNADGFADKKGEQKCIAYITDAQIEKNPNIELYWLQGLLKRRDITDSVKKYMCERMGILYPAIETEDNIVEDICFAKWIINNEKAGKFEISKFEYMPLISVVVPVYNVISEQLIECIESVRKQTYKNWELILVDDCSTWESVRPILQKYEQCEKINVIYRDTNGNISKTTNDGIFAAKGEYIAFMDCDDVITENALYEMVKKLNENKDYDFIYSDEDKITDDGTKRYSPFFKPDWSPDLFMSLMYTNHLAIYRASIVKAIGGLRSAFDGAQDYDFTLRFMEQSDNDKVGHIPKILYHWRARPESLAATPSAKSYALLSVKNAKEDMLRRRGIEGRVEYISDMFQYRMVYDPVDNPLVSIVIPSKDNPRILMQCIDSLMFYTSYKNYEIIVVDNGSNEANRRIISKYLDENNARYIYEKQEFNFSRMCNIGASVSEGEYILFLNDDIEIFQKDWLTRMLGQACQSHVGAVGAKLLYPDSTIIQHAGLVNLKPGPSHTLILQDDAGAFYFGRNRVDVNYSAVTAACILINKEKFQKIGGFDEAFPVAYNDVDLCFRLLETGYYNVQRNDVVAYHHESFSRGNDNYSKSKLRRLRREMAHLNYNHQKLVGNDPFYNCNLSPVSNDCSVNIQYDSMDIKKRIYIKDEKYGVINIDSVEIHEDVRISGWSYLDFSKQNDFLKRELVLRDKNGKCIFVHINRIERNDVWEARGQRDNMHLCGFMACIDMSKLSLENMEYQIGILTYIAPNIPILTMSKNTIPMRCDEDEVLKISHAQKESYDEYMKKCKVVSEPFIKYSVDEIIIDNIASTIKGFAFLNIKDSYLYKTNLMLKNNDNCIVFDTFYQKRFDVAAVYAGKPYIQTCGFVCNIYNEMLDMNAEYKICIIMSNKFNNSSYIVETGKSFTMRRDI